MLRSWLERPLLSVTAITRRSAAVGQLVDHTMVREELALALSGIGDMERLVGRIVYGTAGGRDVVALKNAMARLPHVKELLSAFDRGRLGELAQLDTLEDLTDLIGRTLCDDPLLRPGGRVHPGGFDRRWTACGAFCMAARASSPLWRPPKRRKPASAP